MIETMIRVALMHGFPWQTLGSIEILSFQSVGMPVRSVAGFLLIAISPSFFPHPHKSRCAGVRHGPSRHHSSTINRAPAEVEESLGAMSEGAGVGIVFANSSF